MFRADTLTVNFLLRFPQALDYLPEDARDTLYGMFTGMTPTTPPEADAPLPFSDLEIETTPHEDECYSCGTVSPEETESCENITDTEGATCETELCSECWALCSDCGATLCNECVSTNAELNARTGNHRCTATAEECRNCGKDLFMQDENETWVYISEEAADYLHDRDSGGAEAGAIHCKECLEDEYEFDGMHEATEGGQIPEYDPEED